MYRSATGGVETHCAQLDDGVSGDVGGYGYNVDPKVWETIFPGSLENITDAHADLYVE